MLETNRDFEKELKLNRRDNILTELALKHEQLDKKVEAGQGNEFATDASITEVTNLQKEIQDLERELKTIEEQNDSR
jgi:hypothetical protein